MLSVDPKYNTESCGFSTAELSICHHSNQSTPPPHAAVTCPPSFQHTPVLRHPSSCSTAHHTHPTCMPGHPSFPHTPLTWPPVVKVHFGFGRVAAPPVSASTAASMQHIEARTTNVATHEWRAGELQEWCRQRQDESFLEGKGGTWMLWRLHLMLTHPAGDRLKQHELPALMLSWVCGLPTSHPSAWEPSRAEFHQTCIIPHPNPNHNRCWNPLSNSHVSKRIIVSRTG